MDESPENTTGEVHKKLSLADRERFYLGELSEAERVKFLEALQEEPDRYHAGDEWLDAKSAEIIG